MKLDSDKAMEVLAKVVKELRANRLWPLAVVLLVAIVAVPIALSKSASSTPVAAVPPAALPSGPGTTLPALNVQSSSSQSRLRGRGRDPFAQPGTSKSGTTGPTSTTGTGSSTATTGPSGTATTSTSASSSPPTSTPSTPPPITPTKKPTPAPTGLGSTESYQVAFAITNSSGGLDTTDPLERLSVLPSEQQPLLIELGVLKSGKRVLFAVQPGTVVGGPGTCTPGPIDCQILSLGQDQTEEVGFQSSGGTVPVALFAVTTITAGKYSSVDQANKARTQESAAGRRLLDSSTLSALSLFRYEPSMGAVVDLRNLGVGGS
jgi:hypothetical protein